MYHSFILITSPQICGDEKFKRYKQLVASYPGVFHEILDIIAFNSNDILEIPNMVKEILDDYKTRTLTTDNHAITTIMSSAYAEIIANKKRTIPEGVKTFLAKYDINVCDENCLYISVPDYVVTVANYMAGELLKSNA